MTHSPIVVVMRSHNDMPLARETAEALARQTRPSTLILCDNASRDGTREALAPYAAWIIDVASGTYLPGRVLNNAMRTTRGEIVVFLNADCTPSHATWLQELVAPFSDSRVAAVFGRQEPRNDCQLLFARDTEMTFGDGTHQYSWRHCFSMAASAIRRSVWESMPFDEYLQYSEDVDWTWRARQHGYEVRYVPSARATHSHNYSLRQWFRRQLGEGRAEASIFRWAPWQRSLLRYTLLPLAAQVSRDVAYCLSHGRVGNACYAPLLRVAQAWGRRHGFRDGLKNELVST